jgi:hypothetical protein
MTNIAMFKITQLEREVATVARMLRRARQMAPINREEAMRLNDEALVLLNKMNREADETLAQVRKLGL